MSTLKQLSGQDATFLYLDTDRASTGGTMIYIYDQSTVPGFATFCHLVPKCGKKGPKWQNVANNGSQWQNVA